MDRISGIFSLPLRRPAFEAEKDLSQRLRVGTLDATRQA